MAFLYVAVTRPSLIASAGGWIAEQFGFDRRVGIFAVYLLGFAMAFQFLWPVFWCVSTIVKLARRFRSRNRLTKGIAVSAVG
jgi:hypothetical protein